MSRAKRFGLLIAVCLASLLQFSDAGFCQNDYLTRLGRWLKVKPVYLVTNVVITERWVSLFEEMNLTDYSLVNMKDANFSALDAKQATLFLLVDREQGNIPDRLAFLVPKRARNLDVGETEAMLCIGRNGKRPSLLISAANGANAYKFLNENVREDRTPLNRYGIKGGPRRVAMEVVPSAPNVLFPRGSISATRPSVFLSYPRKRQTVRLRFDIQIAPTGQAIEHEREEFPDDVNEFETDGGWIAFDQELSEARNHELEQWGVELTAEQRRSGAVVYIYKPEFDVRAGTAYELRARAVYEDNYGKRVPGEWSSVISHIAIQVAAQPSNLPPATRVTATPDVNELDARYSNDGNYIICSADRTGFQLYEIYMTETANPTGGATRVTVTNRGATDYQPCWGPVSPDGTNFVTFVRREAAGISKRIRRIWYVGVPTPDNPNVPSGYTRITNFEQSCYSPAWNPAGNILAYVKEAERGPNEIWVLSNEQGNRVLVQGITPVWSTDGKRLYYSSNTNGTWDIWRMDLATGQQTAVTTESGNEFSPAINPTNGDLAFVSSDAGNFDIWLLSGGNTRQLTQWYGQDRDPAWDPTGQHITYSTTCFSSGGRYDLATLSPYEAGINAPAGTGTGAGGAVFPTLPGGTEGNNEDGQQDATDGGTDQPAANASDAADQQTAEGDDNQDADADADADAGNNTTVTDLTEDTEGN